MSADLDLALFAASNYSRHGGLLQCKEGWRGGYDLRIHSDATVAQLAREGLLAIRGGKATITPQGERVVSEMVGGAA